MQMQERKIKMALSCSFAICMVLSVIGICLNYQRVFNIVKSIPCVGWIIEYNFPPQDYYVPIVDIPLSKGVSYAEFVCKYNGRYDIQIANITKDKFYKSGISLKVMVSKANKSNVIWSGGDTNSTQFIYYPNENSEENEFRYWYDAFRVPEKIPLNTKMRLTVICSGDVSAFLTEHKNAHIQVRKVFDK